MEYKERLEKLKEDFVNLKEDYDSNDGYTHQKNIEKSIDRLKTFSSQLNRSDLFRKFDNLYMDIKKTINALNKEWEKQNK